MLVNRKWLEYELLDAGNGAKLERWGKYVLERPDPQAIWQADVWRGQDAIYHRSAQGGGSWEYLHKVPASWLLHYPGYCATLCFKIEPGGFKHTGVFPEQGANWDYIAQRITLAKQAALEMKILNLFAYTGGASLAAASAKAQETVHVDASKGMNQRAKENLELSNLQGENVRFITDDVFKFVARELRRGRQYQGIILDPPSYGRGPQGEIWKIEEALWSLLKQLVLLLDTKHPYAFLIINSYTTGLSPLVMQNFLQLLLGSSQGAYVEAFDLCLPASQRNILLPCGSTCRWQNKPEDN